MAMLFTPTAYFVVQTRPCASQAPADWQDVRTYDEDGPAFDWADYLREDGDTDARVVRRWR
jgi:hypothetical protein